MKNPNVMTSTGKVRYIFAKNKRRRMFPGGRFAWISECLLGDIRTFLDGIDHYIQNKQNLPDRGGGNLSLPILISTALEFVSSLYAGKTEYKDGNKYNATNNVKDFICHFFPDMYKNLPLLLWDGIRNGLVHTFSPKPFTYKRKKVRFQFYVEDKTVESHVTKIKNTVLIRINSFQLYKVFKRALKKYQKELEINDELKNNFILAWSSIEEYSRNIDNEVTKSKEVKTLLSELKKKGNNYLVLLRVNTV